MSPNVGNFVHDLVEMAKAMEELPQVQAKLAHAETMMSNQAVVIMAREESILKLKAEIEALNAKVHSAEVARDDAELRFLEADDRATHATLALRGVQTALGSAIAVIDPPKPEPEVAKVAPMVFTEGADGSTASSSATATDWTAPPPSPVTLSGDPANVDSWASKPVSEVVSQVEEVASDPVYPAPQGQSESPLTGTHVQTQDSSASVSEDIVATGQGQSETLPTARSPIDESSALSESADKQDGASSQSPKPYVGKLYHDHDKWVSRRDWIEGGGTDDSYDWRPGRMKPGETW